MFHKNEPYKENQLSKTPRQVTEGSMSTVDVGGFMSSLASPRQEAKEPGVPGHDGPQETQGGGTEDAKRRSGEDEERGRRREG